MRKRSSFLKEILIGAFRSAVQRKKASVFLNKLIGKGKTKIKHVVNEYFKLNSFLRDLGQKTIEAFLMNSQFIPFTKLAQKIF